MKALIPKLDFTRFFRRLGFKTCKVFVLAIGLAVLFLFYENIAHADAVYYWTKTMGGANEDYSQTHQSVLALLLTGHGMFCWESKTIKIF